MSKQDVSEFVAYTSEHVPLIWEDVSHYVQRALDQGSNYTLDEIYEGLCNCEMQLWTSQKKGEIEAALVTSIQQDETNLFCLLLTVGGEGMDVWKNWLPIVEDWAREHGADEMRIYGRRGWAKVLGYDIQWTLMSKDLWRQEH